MTGVAVAATRLVLSLWPPTSLPLSESQDSSRDESLGADDGAGRGARARRHPLLQFLGSQIRARPHAFVPVAAHLLAVLPRARRLPPPRLDACRGLARAVLLVEIQRLRVRRHVGLVPAAR